VVRVAEYIDKILRGRQAKRTSRRAGDPICAADHLKAAKELGLIVSASLIALVDEVIE